MKKILFICSLAATWCVNAQTIENTFLFDFGGSGSRGTLSTATGWNNIAPSTESATSMPQFTTFSNLVDKTGAESNIKLVLTTAWGVNGNSGGGGLYNPDSNQLGDLALETATVDYMFNTNDTESGRSFVLAGLDANKGYKFTIFGSRASNDVRRGNYILSGANSWMTDMQVAGSGLGANGENQRTGDAPVSDIIFPDAAGNITLWIENHSKTYVPLSCMKMEVVTGAEKPALSGNVARTFFFDFGSEAANRGQATNLNGWNNILANSGNDCSAGTQFSELVDSEGATTALTLSVDTKFTTNGYSTGLGLPSPSSDLLGDLAVETATYDYFFVDQSNASGQMTFAGLDPSKSYRFYTFASRKATDARLGAYRFEGLNSWTGAMQAAGNALDNSNSQNEKVILVSEPIFPDNDGKIVLTMINGQKVYLPVNAMKIEELSNVERPDLKNYTSLVISGDGIAQGETTEFVNRGKNLFELYISTQGGAYSLEATDSDGNKVQLPLENLASGINRITVDLNTLEVSTLPVTYFCVEGSAVGGWNTTGVELTYQGQGIWNYKGQISGYDTTSDPGRVNFIMNKSWDHQFKRVSGSASKLAYNEGDDIPLNPGTYDITVDLNNMTWVIANGLDELDPYRVTVMGSSVSNGQGATNNEGYAHLFNLHLGERNENGLSENPFYISNIAINGNSSVDLLNRFDDLEREYGKYVIFGISLGNEGIHGASDQNAIYNQFKTNMGTLIAKAREIGKEPIVMNNYTRLDFVPSDYDAIKRMNDEIARWDVPSINMLGAIDNGAGQWASGYQIDTDIYHPNTAGHQEFFYAMVPSMLDAMHQGKELAMTRTTTDTFVLPSKNTIEFTPDGTVHSFTLAFSVSPNSDATVATINVAGSDVPAKISYEGGNFTATLPDGTDMTINASEGLNEVVLSQNYARKHITFSVNGMTESKTGLTPFAPMDIALGESNKESALTFGELMFYRSSMHTSSPFTEDGSLNKSSLEVYVPMTSALENKAMSTIEVSLADNSSTSIEEVGTVEATFSVSSTKKGVIDVYTSMPTPVNVCNVAGQIVDKATVNGHFSFSPLSPGLYIVNHKKVIVK